MSIEKLKKILNDGKKLREIGAFFITAAIENNLNLELTEPMLKKSYRHRQFIEVLKGTHVIVEKTLAQKLTTFRIPMADRIQLLDRVTDDSQLLAIINDHRNEAGYLVAAINHIKNDELVADLAIVKSSGFFAIERIHKMTNVSSLQKIILESNDGEVSTVAIKRLARLDQNLLYAIAVQVTDIIKVKAAIESITQVLLLGKLRDVLSSKTEIVLLIDNQYVKLREKIKSASKNVATSP